MRIPEGGKSQAGVVVRQLNRGSQLFSCLVRNLPFMDQVGVPVVGARVGTYKEQFDDRFRGIAEILELFTQMKAYMAPGRTGAFSVLGVVGVGGSPTNCRCHSVPAAGGCWGGEVLQVDGLAGVLSTLSPCPPGGSHDGVSCQMHDGGREISCCGGLKARGPAGSHL